jgi:hypothetical protein
MDSISSQHPNPPALLLHEHPRIADNAVLALLWLGPGLDGFVRAASGGTGAVFKSIFVLLSSDPTTEWSLSSAAAAPDGPADVTRYRQQHPILYYIYLILYDA